MLGALAVVLTATATAARGRSPAFVDEGWVNGHWGSEGSGLWITDGPRVLLVRRSLDSLHPGTWGIPGGAVPVEAESRRPRSALASAVQETKEELGHLPTGIWIDPKPAAVYRAKDGSGFRYTTFLARVSPGSSRLYVPRLNREHSDWGWHEREAALDLDLHPGVRWFFAQKGIR
jgi:8-oxo-dGTP pyrophosphatase MutT (NUDIX family)